MFNKLIFFITITIALNSIFTKNLQDYVKQLEEELNCKPFTENEEMKQIDQKHYKNIHKENYFEYNYDFPDEILDKNNSKLIIIYKLERDSIEENMRQTEEIVTKLKYVKKLQQASPDLNKINIQNYYGCYYKTQPKTFGKSDKMSRIYIIVDYLQKYYNTDYDFLGSDTEQQRENFLKQKSLFNLFLKGFGKMKQITDLQFVDLSDKQLYIKDKYDEDKSQILFPLFDLIPNQQESQAVLLLKLQEAKREDYYKFYPKIVHGCFIKQSCNFEMYMKEQEMWTLALFVLEQFNYDMENFFNKTLHCPFITVNSICNN